MKIIVRASLIVLLLSAFVWAAQDVVSAVHGTITKLDSGAKTMVVKTADGVEHTFKFLGSTAVHGVKAMGTGTKDAFHGLTEGSEVVAHYTAKGAEETAVEVDKVGKDGMKGVEGTVTHVDRGAKTIWRSRPRTARKKHLSCPITQSRMRARASEKEPRKAPRLRSTTRKTPARKSRTSSRNSNSLKSASRESRLGKMMARPFYQSHS